MMIKLLYYSFALTLILISSSCQKDNEVINAGNGLPLVGIDLELMDALEDVGGIKGANHFLLPESNDLDNIPQDPNNPLSNVKIELGRKLFYETGLAINPNKPESTGTYSCASCHVPGSNFQPGIRQGISEGGVGFGIVGEARLPNYDYEISDLDIQSIRTPTVMHAAYNRTSLWNGQFGATGFNEGTEANWTLDTPKETNLMGYEGTEIQAIAGLKVHRMGVNMNLINSTYYRDLFDMAFADIDESERYTRETMGLAIAAYERTIIANKAPFQNWLKGERDAITEQQKLGALLFFGKAGCNDCHDGPALNSESFFALGMNDLSGEGFYDSFSETDILNTAKGRGGFTGNSEEDYQFKTPQIYSLKVMNFLGHGASFTSVREVVEYKNAGIAENAAVPESQLVAGFQPLELTEDEIDQLTDFVENALNDKEIQRYVPVTVASGNCFPNNDSQSQVDMGCE
ncbi:MAG: cytochrome c peroxidase [Maribacter sp.]|jgi:cytochrome c peroxidase